MKNSLQRMKNSLRLLGHFLGGAFLFQSRRVTRPQEMWLIHKLRGEVFGEGLKWVRNTPRGLDLDHYDRDAIHFGVFQRGELLACSRMVPSTRPLMLDHEFRSLVKGINVKKGPDRVEISRLCVAPHLKYSHKGEVVKAYLYRTMYRYARSHGMRYWYIVVEPNYLDKLTRYFGFEQLGEAFRFEDGCVAVAAMGDMVHASRVLRWSLGPVMRLWYVGVQGLDETSWYNTNGVLRALQSQIHYDWGESCHPHEERRPDSRMHKKTMASAMHNAGTQELAEHAGAINDERLAKSTNLMTLLHGHEQI